MAPALSRRSPLHYWREARAAPPVESKYIVQSRICVMLMEVKNDRTFESGSRSAAKLNNNFYIEGHPLPMSTVFGQRPLPRSQLSCSQEE